MTWTPERITELERLWAQGLGVAQIAARLGVSTTATRGSIETLRRAGKADLPYRITRTEWTREKIAELEALWAQGLTTKRIAEHFSVTRTAANTVVRNYRARGANLPPRSAEHRAATNVKWTDARKAAFARMWVAGCSNEQIAAQFGVLPAKVPNLAWRLRKEGVDLPSRATREPLSARQITELKRMWRDGTPQRAIADALDVPRSSLAVTVKALRAAGHDLPERAPAAPVLSDEALAALMTSGDSASQIAKRHGLDVTTVRRRAAKLRASGVQLPKARGSRWTRQQTSALVRHWRVGEPVERIAKLLHTTPSAVYQQAARLRAQGVDLRDRKDQSKWTAARDNALKALWRQGLTAREVASRLGTTEAAISHRVNVLRASQPGSLPARRGVRPVPTAAQLEELWPQGLSYQQMADRLACSVPALSHTIETARKQGANLPYRPKRGVWTDERRAELVRLWADPDLTVEQIASGLGESAHRVSGLVVKLRAKGYDLPPRIPALWPPEQVEVLESLWHAGERKDRIAAHFGVSARELQNMVARLRAAGADIPAGRPAQVWTNDRIAELEAMWDAGEATARIAAHFEVSERALTSLIHYLRERGHHFPQRQGTPRVWDENRIAELEALWARELTAKRIATHLGVSVTAVQQAVSNGRKDGRSFPRRLRWSAWPPDRDEALLALQAGGLPHREIARRLGTTAPAVAARLTRLRASETAAR